MKTHINEFVPLAVAFALLSGFCVRALVPTNDGGTPPLDCRGLPATAEINLDWRGLNVAGCKVDLLCSRSKIHIVSANCQTIGYYEVPPSLPRQWIILNQPNGANAQIDSSGNLATLSLPLAGDYTVQLILCPSNNCSLGLWGLPAVPLLTGNGTITVHAYAELPMRPQDMPALPPSAFAPTPRLGLTDAERSCKCQSGGGLINPQWVTVNNWSGPQDYQLLEGWVVKSWLSGDDAPFNHDLAWSGGDWYVIHDINVDISPDPRYNGLLSTNSSEPSPYLIECEAQNDKIPERFRPVEGDRISLWGFWICDCGHPPFATEIHPVVGWAVHRNLPVRIPGTATFTFDLFTNTVVSTAGTNLYVPGVISDLWFNADTGDVTGGGVSTLAQPARCNPIFPQCLQENTSCAPYLDGGRNITASPIQREYDFNIYLPKNPSQVFAEAGQTRPRAPLYVNIYKPFPSVGPDPVVTRVTETTNGITYEYLHVHLDLRGLGASTYSRRIEAAWVYPAADNWGLEQWRVSLDSLDIYDDLDSKVLFPGSDGDWILWLMLPSADQAWTRILDGFNNAHGTMTFNPPWQTGSLDPKLQRPPLELDPGRRLGPDVLVFAQDHYLKYWMHGYEADEGYDDDLGRIAGFLYQGANNFGTSDNGVFSAHLSGQRIATLNNGVLSPAAAALAGHYLLACTNKINNKPRHDLLAPLAQAGLLADGFSAEPPWYPTDPQQLYGGSAALVGDVNGDGFPDMVLGTKGTNFEARLFFGGRNGFPPAPGGTITLPYPNPGGADYRLAGAGDVNGDGVPDLLIGVPSDSNGGTNAGAAFLFSGAQLGAGGALTQSNAAWFIEAGLPNGQFGYSLAGAGDINGDGFGDVVVAAPFYQNSIVFGRPLGRVFVYYGSSNGLAGGARQALIPASISGSPHWFGYSVAGAGDVNHDGYADVIVGAPLFTHPEANEGAIFLYYGSPTGLVLNTAQVIEGNIAGAQFGYAVASAGDVNGDHYADVLVGTPYYTFDDTTFEAGYASLFRGSSAGLIPSPSWGRLGPASGAHFGSDLAGVGDLNGDGFGDVAIVAEGDFNTDGLHGRVSYFLGEGSTSGLSQTETWRTWGGSAVAKPPVTVPASDVNVDGFDDVLVFDPNNGGEAFRHVQLILGWGQHAIVPHDDPFFESTEREMFAFQSVASPREFAAALEASGQTNSTKIASVLAKVRDLYLLSRERGGDPAGMVQMLLNFQQVVPADLFNQYFANVDLDLGTAFYIDCGATQEYRDALGRWWEPDGPFLVTSSADIATFPGITVDDSLLGDRYLPNEMLHSERSFIGDIRYQVAVPNGWYTVLLYFSENDPAAASPALGGTGCGDCARIFDLEVEGQRLNAYNQADAALPPNGDGRGAIYTGTQVSFTVQVSDEILDIAVIDRGDKPLENTAIKGIAILGRPAPATKFATRPSIDRWLTGSGTPPGLQVDPQASLARFLAGEIPLRVQSSRDLIHWQTLPALPVINSTTNGLRAFFSIPALTNAAGFYRAVVTNSPSF